MVLTVPLQLNFTVIIGVLFKLLIMMFSYLLEKQETNRRCSFQHWQLLHLNLFGYVCYYRILVLTVPLQLNFTVIIGVLFKLLIMMSSMNVLNILRLIVTSFVIICFRVHLHFSLFPIKIS